MSLWYPTISNPIRRDEEGFYWRWYGIEWTRRIKLSKGHKLHVTLYREDGDILLGIFAGRGRLRKGKEGTPTGPGGTEVWEVMRRELPNVTFKAKNMIRAPYTRLRVTPATPELEVIYRRFFGGNWDWRVDFYDSGE